MTYLPYAGIGARKTPKDICDLMTQIASTLEEGGFSLRSGGADRADTAFEIGVQDPLKKEIYIPWVGYNNRHTRDSTSQVLVGFSNTKAHFTALEIARVHHPNWSNCSNAARKLHARNIAQLFGWALDVPSKFVVCWTPNGKVIGGTGQTIRVAKACNIPVFNLGGDTLAVMKQLEDYANTLI